MWFIRIYTFPSDKVRENVSYLDLGDGYMSIYMLMYTSQNSLSYTLGFVHFSTCTSIKKKNN